MNIPYPLASIVEHDGDKLIVESISERLQYSLSGHSKLNSRAMGRAWIPYSELTLVAAPTEYSWELWCDVQDDDGPEFKYG